MISLSPYENFQSKFHAVGCYVENDGKVLVLKRAAHKPQPHTWCLPSGKVGETETPEQAVLRELMEETGIQAIPEQLIFGVECFVRYDTYDFIFYTYSLPLEVRPEITIQSDEHSDYAWETKENILKLPLIPDFEEQMELHYETK